MAAPRKSAASPRSESNAPVKKSAPAKKSAPSKRAPAGSNGQGTAKKPTAMAVARSAARQLTELTGREPECVIGIERDDDGWYVEVEVVESRRIPDSTDILATYGVQVDDDGDLLGYRRVRRYVRGKGGDGDGGGR